VNILKFKSLRKDAHANIEQFFFKTLKRPLTGPKSNIHCLVLKTAVASFFPIGCLVFSVSGGALDPEKNSAPLKKLVGKTAVIALCLKLLLSVN
jgi:hypothetical protein